MSEPLDPLPPQLQALFDAERPGEHVAPEQAAQIFKAVEASYAGGSAAGGAAAHAGFARALTTKKLVAIGVGLFGGGVATGAGVTRLLSNPAPVVIAAPATPTATPTATATPTPTAPAARHRVEPAPVAAPVPPSRLDSDLGAEQAELEVARTALQRGKPLAALDALEDHKRQFPRGRLAEEREALRVQALAAAGEREAALKAAESFQRDYPQSLFGPAVDAVLKQAH